MEGVHEYKLEEVGIRNPYPVRGYSQTHKSKYCCFHKIHGHNTNSCIQLKDAKEGLIKKGRLAEYTNDNKEVVKSHRRRRSIILIWKNPQRKMLKFVVLYM